MLWYCGVLCFLFLNVERALVLCYIFLRVKRALVLWHPVLYIFAFETLSGIVKFHVISLSVWNALWYCGGLCYIFPPVERAPVLWNSVLYIPLLKRALFLKKFKLYFSACKNCSVFVGFCVIYF